MFLYPEIVIASTDDVNGSLYNAPQNENIEINININLDASSNDIKKDDISIKIKPINNPNVNDGTR